MLNSLTAIAPLNVWDPGHVVVYAHTVYIYITERVRPILRGDQTTVGDLLQGLLRPDPRRGIGWGGAKF